MAIVTIVKPFKAIRPNRDKVALVSSKSMETYTQRELKNELTLNPFSFLHVVYPEYQHRHEFTSERRFQMVHDRYLEFKKNEILLEEETPSLYVYEISDSQHSFSGIIAVTAVEDYTNGLIKKHEGTIENRVQLFEKYLRTTGFNAEPVLLMFEDDAKVDDLIIEVRKQQPEYEFSTTDKKNHRLWLVQDLNTIETIRTLFHNKNLYIADGHHRAASSELLKKELQEKNKSHNSTESYNYFMSYIIPESSLKISEFYRFSKDLNGLSKTHFLAKLNEHFKIENKGSQFFKPSQKHHFSMYLSGEFYSLSLIKNRYTFSDQLSKLDTEILFRTILKPILGIHNLENNDRVGYSNNKFDPLSMKVLVDTGDFEVSFGMLPITIEEMKEVANAKMVMPPKTSYIEPKLLSGLTLYEF